MILKKYAVVLLTIALIITTTQLVKAQITTDPALPTADSPVTLHFDATGTALQGYTGILYTHTGLIIEGLSGWQYVIGEWGDNDVQPQLTRLDEDLYELQISPSIRDFYGAAESDVITNMAFVFRAASPPPQSPDYLVDVVESGLVVVITSPTGMQPVYEVDDIITLSATANFSNSIELYVNEVFIASTTEEELSYDWVATETGRFDVRFVAEGGNAETDEATTYFYVRPEVPVAELPENVENGINYIDDNTVTLVLHDPPAFKEFVFAIGDFNDWEVDENSFMNRTPDSEYFWITVSGLVADTEYAFQYYVDGELRLADPYTHKVLDPWNDVWINDFNYPNLMAYPEGKTTGIVSILHPGKEVYEWEVSDFNAPEADELVIYELLIRDFVETSAIKTVMDSLDYLQELGVNVIELMPVNQFEGNISWGYNPSFYFATDKAYGTTNDYKRFIDECHKRGIAVVIDMVLNHSFGLSPLVQMYFDENAGDWGQPAPENPWFNEICPHEPWCWGYDFNHESPYTVDFVNRVNEFWLTEFKVDGFRFDFTKGFTNTESDGWSYDASRIQILKNMADHIWSVNPDTYIILEHFTDNSEEKELAEYGMLVWGNMTHAYQEAAMGYMADSDFSWISYQERQWAVPHLVGYMESHDEERMMFKNLQYGNSLNPAHDIKNLDVALKRIELAATFFIPVPGPKMIWQFGELGYDYSINHCQDGSIDDGCRTDPKPIRWDYFDDWKRKRVYYVFSALSKLKTNHDIFKTDDYTLSLEGEMKKIHLSSGADHVTIIGNFGLEQGIVDPNFQKTGTWYEYFMDEEIVVEDVNAAITLQAGEYKLYSTTKFPSHGYPLNTDGNEYNPETLDVFPNPSETLFNFSFVASQNEVGEIEIFDVKGKRVYSKAVNISAGYNSWTWNITGDNGEKLPVGIYVYRVILNSNAYTGKLLAK